jgi:hypothetical protein
MVEDEKEGVKNKSNMRSFILSAFWVDKTNKVKEKKKQK